MPVHCAGIEFFDGFDKNGEECFEHNIERIYSDNYPASYFNLHGSIHYKTVKKNSYSFSWVCTPDKVNKISSGGPTSSDQTRRALIYTNILAGLYKPSKILLTPHYQFYQKFHDDCLSADIILTIGYSFGDNHINMVIVDGATIKKPNIVEITYKPKWINRQEASLGATVWGNMSISNILTSCNNDSNLYHDGPGWGASRNQSRKIYWKGFEEFLKNNQWKMIGKK